MRLFASLIIALTALAASAEDYIIIGKETKVFENPTTKSYAVTNRFDEEITLQPGMAFPVIETAQGWARIEYTPGLKGYIQVLSEAKTTSRPTAIRAGKYEIANLPCEKLEIVMAPKLSARDTSATYDGEAEDNILLFRDQFGNPAYTAVILDGHTIIYSYDPKLTRLL